MTSQQASQQPVQQSSQSSQPEQPQAERQQPQPEHHPDPPSAGRRQAQIDRAHEVREQAANPGSDRAVRAQHERGKLTARERIEALLDSGSFVEQGALARNHGSSAGVTENRPYGDGVVTGYGTVDGRTVCVFAHDFTVYGGSMGEVFGKKVMAVMDLAVRIGCPVIGINDSGGARIQEGVVALAHYAEVGMRNVRASGVVPQISMIMGPCAGGAVYTPAITDFTVMVESTSHMFITGPDVLRGVTGAEITTEELGGALTNNAVSGNAHYLAADEPDAVDWVRTLIGYLPPNNLAGPPQYTNTARTEVTPSDLELDSLIPDSPHASYDMRAVITRIIDDGELLEVQPLFAGNLICAFARIEGRTVGVVANQPLVSAGAIDIDASEKGARFVRFCDAFEIPILTLTDVPGYLPGVQQETGGIIRRGAKLAFAYCEATVPKVTVVTRKAYGGGYAVMGSKHLGGDTNLAWPSAEIAVMGAESAVDLLHRKELSAAGAEAPTMRAKLIDEYSATLCTPYLAAERGYIDAVIAPSRTRLEVAMALRGLRDKRLDPLPKKHNTMPM